VVVRDHPVAVAVLEVGVDDPGFMDVNWMGPGDREDQEKEKIHGGSHQDCRDLIGKRKAYPTSGVGLVGSGCGGSPSSTRFACTTA
jgi:hypothetical protein